MVNHCYILCTLGSTCCIGIFSALKIWKLVIRCGCLHAETALGSLVDASNSFRANLGHPIAGSCSVLLAVLLIPISGENTDFHSLKWIIFSLEVLCPITQYVSLNSRNKKGDYQPLFCWESADEPPAIFHQQPYNLTLFLEEALNFLGKK